jgi:hypothetical protein
MNRNSNLRDWEPTSGDAKHVDQTKMLNTEARETPETVTATNSTKEHVTSHPTFGTLGVTGRH